MRAYRPKAEIQLCAAPRERAHIFVCGPPHLPELQDREQRRDGIQLACECGERRLAAVMDCHSLYVHQVRGDLEPYRRSSSDKFLVQVASGHCVLREQVQDDG